MIKPVPAVVKCVQVATLALVCSLSTQSLPEGVDDGADQVSLPEHGIHYLEIVTPDPEAARKFYGEAYGWEFEDARPELGDAFVAQLPGGSLCGIRAPMAAHEQPTVRTYLRVLDVSASIQRAAELGGTIALGPTVLPGQGTIAIYLYGGIEQGLWQVP